MPSVLPPTPSQRVIVLQPTPPQGVQKEVSTPKPLSSALPIKNKTIPKTEDKPKRQTHPMIVDNSNSVQESLNLDRINMARISDLVRKNILSSPVARNHCNLYNDLLHLLLGRYRVIHSKVNFTGAGVGLGNGISNGSGQGGRNGTGKSI